MVDLRGGEAADRMCLFNRKLVSQPGLEVGFAVHLSSEFRKHLF